MFEDYYMTVDEVAKALKISKSFAYKVIRKMNAEMQEQGFFTMAGRVNKQFFLIENFIVFLFSFLSPWYNHYLS